MNEKKFIARDEIQDSGPDIDLINRGLKEIREHADKLDIYKPHDTTQKWHGAVYTEVPDCTEVRLKQPHFESFTVCNGECGVDLVDEDRVQISCKTFKLEDIYFGLKDILDERSIVFLASSFTLGFSYKDEFELVLGGVKHKKTGVVLSKQDVEKIVNALEPFMENE